MNCQRTQFACGVVCLSVEAGRLDALQRVLNAEYRSGKFGFAVVFFSKSGFSAQKITSLMRIAAPGLQYAACSTAGELTPAGMVEGQAMVLLWPSALFRIKPSRIGQISETGIERTVSAVADSKRSFLETLPSDHRNVFAVCLMDGLSYKEEMMTAAIHWGLEEVPLLGGSAGDDLNFSDTSLILNGDDTGNCALLLLISTSVPSHIFKTENFVPTNQKLVVTRSDPARRIVYELNALPAAIAYAEVIGTDPASLAPQSFASHPLVVRVGGEYYCRSIQKVNNDHSLSFFCAIDDGIVLTVAEPQGMAQTTRDAFQSAREVLGAVDFVLGFDCVLRQIDARNRQVTHKMSEIYRQNNVIGFNTYGEQYRAMHLNQTFTGIAFGPTQQATESALERRAG